MYKNNKKSKITCFFCKYEIQKHNKSNNTVLFKNQSKPICKYCTKNKHKPLEIIYKNHDTQCKLCKKPVMFKNCIACSICDCFYHGKCLNLSKNDIQKIENVCNFFLCSTCNKDILPCPIECDNDRIKIKDASKLNLKECFTCKNVVSKERYSNKFFIYNNKIRSVCKNCSSLNKDIPVKDKNSIEFLDCPICRHQVKYESIFCNLCQHWVHPYCNSISKIELKKLSESSDDWHCYSCNLKIYPNNMILNSPVSLDNIVPYIKWELKINFLV